MAKILLIYVFIFDVVSTTLNTEVKEWEHLQTFVKLTTYVFKFNNCTNYVYYLYYYYYMYQKGSNNCGVHVQNLYK